MRRSIRFFGPPDLIRSRLAALGREPEGLEIRTRALDSLIEFDADPPEFFDVCEILGEEMYSDDNRSLARSLADFLAENGMRISVAESFTGGMVAARIVDVAGASKIFEEGVVTYSDHAKRLRLGVRESTLETHGAVSSQTAKEMAQGLLFGNADLGVSTTGIAGPGGGTDEKPVGTGYIGLALRDCETIAFKTAHSGTRNEIREAATNAALFLAYRHLMKNATK